MAKLTDRRVTRWMAWFVVWTLLGLAFASQFYFSSAQFGNPVTWRRALSHSLSDWYVFALLSIPAIGLARRLPIERGHWGVALGAHFMASVGFSLSYGALRSGVAVWQSAGAVEFGQTLRALLVKSWHFNLVVYWVIAAVVHAFDYYDKFRDHELHAAELERHLTEARLQALQMQLNPHFLFNTLHAISSLMHKDVEAADRMLVRLGDLLRHALEATDRQEVTLREELDFLARYAEIEQTRFGDRLKIRIDVAPETLEALVPNLVLQPLLENAIRHGIEPNGGEGRISVQARRANGVLSLAVADNGEGLPEGMLVEGVGLSNTRARLAQLYAERHRFALQNAADGGLVVSIDIPFHTAGAREGATS